MEVIPTTLLNGMIYRSSNSLDLPEVTPALAHPPQKKQSVGDSGLSPWSNVTEGGMMEDFHPKNLPPNLPEIWISLSGWIKLKKEGGQIVVGWILLG